MSKQAELVEKAETAIATSQPSDLTSLMRVALEQGSGVESLERLFALYERDQENKAKRAFSAAMARFQAECPVIPKSKRAGGVKDAGNQFSYAYAPRDVVAKTIAPYLEKNELSYTFDTKQEDGNVTAICTVRHAAGHSETSHASVPIDSKMRCNDIQKVGGAMEYAMRYALIQAFGLSASDEDTDATDMSKIGPGQCADLEALIEETKANKARFLKVFGVERVEDLSVANFGPAVAMLQAKRK